MGRLFGTDGARGVAITELTCEMAMQIGRAAALVLTKETKHRAKIFIGKDTRISSDILEAALCAGICSVGAEAVKLGVVPTPAVAYLVRTHGADAGVMISASHNSVEFNGIKLFAATGYKLPDAIEAEIEALILDHLTDGALRFGNLQRLMPKVTPKMLTQQLRELEKDGLVQRHVYPVVPPKVEYELTDFGQTVLPILDAMCVWGREYLDDQQAKDRKKS